MKVVSGACQNILAFITEASSKIMICGKSTGWSKGLSSRNLRLTSSDWVLGNEVLINKVVFIVLKMITVKFLCSPNTKVYHFYPIFMTCKCFSSSSFLL
jgi:hypothetical protein